jgi:hypothetical protein
MNEELRECLALQQEIAAKRLELRKRYKALIESERAKGNEPVSVILDGEIWVLKRTNDPDLAEELEAARKLGGFWNYRLVRIGRPVR